MILRGYGTRQFICATSNCGSASTNASTTLQAMSGFAGPIISANAADVTIPAVTTNLRAVGIQDMSFDATGDSSLTGHFLVETFSLSNPFPFRNLSFMGHQAGGILFAASLTSTSTYSGNPYVPEGIILEDFWSNSLATTVSAPAVKLWGVNQSRLTNGRIFAGSQQPVFGSTADVAAIEVSSDNYELNAGGITLENLSGGGYAIWLRIKGADNNRVPCSTPPTSGGCSITASHIAHQGIYMKDNFIEGYNRGIVIGDESNFSGGTRNYTEDFYATANNRYITQFGSSPKLADVNWLAGGEIDPGILEGGSLIVLGAQTQQVSSLVPWNGGTFPVQSSSTANLIQLRITPLSLAALPTPTGCVGMTAICTNCTCASGAACSSGGGYRGVVWNGSAWLGQ